MSGQTEFGQEVLCAYNITGFKKKLGMVSLTLTFLHEGNCVDLYKLKNWKFIVYT